ncbi:MAG: phosphodiester glycosidase family protein [Clostridiales bacterium]|nr:phosphodiester glycosidase family protein [Clostridiales bacterium]
MNQIHLRRGCMALLLCAALCAPLRALGEALPIDLSGGMPPREECYQGESVYEDDSIRVEIERMEVNRTQCYVARITIRDASQLRTAPAYAFNRAQTAEIDAIARRVNAVFAVSGDYFAYQLQNKGSYLIRQGQMYADVPIDGRDVLVIDSAGDFHIVRGGVKEETKAAIEALSPLGIVNTFNFGPGLVIEGEVLDPAYDAVFNFSEGKHRRCAIAQVERGRLEYLCICCDGSKDEGSTGMTLAEFSAFVASLGVQNAYNLDGGNTTAMYFGGSKINAENSAYSRPISDIIYFASTAKEE